MYYLTQSLHRNAQTLARHAATIFLDRQHTWAQMHERVSRLAGAFRGMGIDPNATPGNRVALLALNSDRYLETYFATWWAGGAIVAMNVRWSAAEHIYSLKDSEPRLLLVDDAFAPLIPALRAGGIDIPVVYMGEKTCPDGMLDYETLLAAKDRVPDAYRHDDQLAGIFYTGGTTGFPKGAMLTHGSLLASAYAVAMEFNTIPQDRYLHAAPMFHLADGAASNAVSLVGTTHVMIPAFTPDGTLDAIAKHRVTHALLVPTMIKMVTDAPRRTEVDTSSLQKILYGAAPIPEPTLLDAMRAFPQAGFLQGYGQTELSPIVSVLPPAYHTTDGPLAGKLRSAGRATFCAEIVIRDEDGNSLPTGEVGEVTVKGPNMMLGYWNKPDETAVSLRNGWVHTGDAGYLDEDGFLFIVDRVKDMIVTGGENVYSTEVENALASHSAVSQAVVVGIPHETWGETVHAFVILRPDGQATAEELQAHCQSLIANYKCPRSVEFRTEPFPLSGAGKILKRELRQPYWSGKERMVN